MMKGYKAFDQYLTCRGFRYEIGKTYELEEGQTLEICKCGFHFCKNPIDVFGYYPPKETTLVGQIEALGEIKQEGTKYVTDKIKIVRVFTYEELQKLIRDGYNDSGKCNTGEFNSGKYNTGEFNSGEFNAGNYNSGDYNSGRCNSGDYNTGDCNTGNRNTGDCNTGKYNTGNRNTGNCNTGSYNSGNYNTGWRNSGNCNSGQHNSGNDNAGLYNSGNYNSGHYNSGDYNSGIFNTDEPYMRAFDKPTDIRYSDFIDSIPFDFFDLCDRIARKELDLLDIARIKGLPNFDAEIFKEITGIDLKDY